MHKINRKISRIPAQEACNIIITTLVTTTKVLVKSQGQRNIIESYNNIVYLKSQPKHFRPKFINLKIARNAPKNDRGYKMIHDYSFTYRTRGTFEMHMHVDYVV